MHVHVCCGYVHEYYYMYMYVFTEVPEEEEYSVSEQPGVVHSSNEGFAVCTIYRATCEQIKMRHEQSTL